MSDSSGLHFYGRHSVLRSLSESLASVEQTMTGRILSLRGRRQVGKSTVVERFVETCGKPYVFVTGVHQAPQRKQLEDATLAITESTRPLPDSAYLAESAARSWREWLGKLALAARSGPVIAVLDEFPWLAASAPAFEGELQAAWDRTLEKLPILLILVGSDVTMMDKLSHHDRPLFGRVRPLAIPALNPAEVAEALPGRSPFEIFNSYLVTGGYPRLVTDLARRSSSVEDYVRASLADTYSPLVTTARLSLDAEFPEPQASYQVLSAIGADDTAHPRFNDVLSAISDPADRERAQTATTRALRTLTDEKALIEREIPAWAPGSSKLRRYRVTDPYLRFWFRYVESQVERISRGRADLAVTRFDRDWSSWRGRSVEPVIREALLRLSLSDQNLTNVESVRPWWTRDGKIEVDVVAATEDSTALVGSIKWREESKFNAHDLDDLRRHRDAVPRSGQALLAGISPQGHFPAGIDVAYSADDLLAAWE